MGTPFVPDDLPLKNLDYALLVDDLARLAGLNRQTTANHVRRLKEAGILAVDRRATGSRPERLAFAELLRLISKDPDDSTD